MTLNLNALCTLAQAKDFLDIPSANTSYDNKLTMYINAASELIENHCDRKFMFNTYSVRRDGRRSDRIVLPQYPVIEIIDVWDSITWDFDDQSKIDEDEYTIEEDSIVVLKARRFSRGNANVRIDFTAGYKSVLDPMGAGLPLPSTLNYACLMFVEYFDSLRSDRRTGVTSKGKQGESISFIQDDIPPQIAKMLVDFIRYEIPLLDALTGNS